MDYVNEKKVFYEIKSLEKLIVRYFFSEIDEKLAIEKIIPTFTLTQLEIIKYVKEHRDQEIYQKNLETILNLRRATVSGVLQTMEKNGLLERVTHTEDARAKKIILNQKAEEVFAIGEKKMKELEHILTKGLSSEDIITFSKILTQMKTNLKEEKERRG